MDVPAYLNTQNKSLFTVSAASVVFMGLTAFIYSARSKKA
jgi:hypothetical protein